MMTPSRMTPAHLNTSLKRDGVILCETVPNDDDEERRQNRRRTIMHDTSNSVDSSLIEENETLKKCLEVYGENKLSRENAWSLSLIDTLYNFLDKHHKSMYNFKIAGSSLEASSKVYSLRVDSIHMDVLRMMADLSAQKFNEKQFENKEEEEGSVAIGGENNKDLNFEATVTENVKKQKSNNQKNVVHTVTKNKETLNAILDTVPLRDPIFGKLNSTVGSINSTNMLMNNILLTENSNLKLCTNFQFWDNSDLPEHDYTDIKQVDRDLLKMTAPCATLVNIQNLDNLKLRPLHTGYVISEIPLNMDKGKIDKNLNTNESTLTQFESNNFVNISDGLTQSNANEAPFLNSEHETSMAFDMNVECEAIPSLSEQVPLVAINFSEEDYLTTEEQLVVNNCRALRKRTVLIEDMRPTDANTQLEYSYRPLDSMSQFWAGPSHWKFRSQKRSQTTFRRINEQVNNDPSQILQQTIGRNKFMKNNKFKPLNFSDTGSIINESFIEFNEHFNNRRAKIQKWDQKKLKLPPDFKISLNYFEQFTLAPWHKFHSRITNDHLATFDSNDDNTNLTNLLRNNITANQYQVSNNSLICADQLNVNDTTLVPNNANFCTNSDGESLPDVDGGNNFHNNTDLEIPTEFNGAPIQITKIIVPFAKRAKVIDMRNLKHNCNTLITQQFKNSLINEHAQPENLLLKDERYADGIAGFRTLYEDLPQLLSQNMKEALSLPIALYAVLQLANEQELRLFPQSDLNDFKIRKIC